MQEWEDRFSIPIVKLDFSVRTMNCLESIGVETVGDLVRQTEQRLRGIPSFGVLSLFEVKRRLSELGLHLGMDPDT